MIWMCLGIVTFLKFSHPSVIYSSTISRVMTVVVLGTFKMMEDMMMMMMMMVVVIDIIIMIANGE